MRAYTVNELFCLTRRELLQLHAHIVVELPVLADAERSFALEMLRNIRCVLAHPRYRP